MMKTMEPLVACLWFDNEAEDAATLYTSVFPNSKIVTTARYPEAAEEVSGKMAGSVMTVEFEINGRRFVALNGGPQFKFNESVSFMISCANQEEVDYYWERLTEGGEESMCGWLKDRFGLSWQVVPRQLTELLGSGNQAGVEAVTSAFMEMRKLDIAALERAYSDAQG